MVLLTADESAELKKPKLPSKNKLKKIAREQKKQIKKQRRKNYKKKIKVDSLKQINEDAAGLDIGISEIYACIPEGRCDENVQRFDTFTSDLCKLADWLSDHNIKTVAMESTGVYWIPIFEILEKRGFNVNLINARR